MWIALALLIAADSPSTDDVRSAEPTIPSPLTLERAEQIFRAQGLDLLIAEAQIAGAEGDLRAAQIINNPSVSGDFLYGFAAGSPSNPSFSPAVPGWSLGLSDNAAIEDILSGKRGLRVNVARRALEAARHSRADAERTLLAQLRIAFVQALLAEDNLQFAMEAQKSYQQTRDLNQLRYDKGDINQVDLSRIVTAQLEALQQTTEARAQLEQAKAALAFLLGVRSHPLTFTLEGSLDYRPLPRIERRSAEQLTEEGLAHRPDLLAAQATREQNGFSLAQAKRSVLPDISLQLGYSQQVDTSQVNGVVSPPTLSVGLQAPIPLFYQQQGEIRRAEANFAVAERQAEKARAQVVTDISQAYVSFTAAREMVQRMEKELLRSAQTSRDLEELLYRKGAASLLDFLDAERTYIAVNLEYRQNLQSYWSSVYQLEEATAVPLQ